MKDPIQEYLDEYREVFNEASKRRERAAKINEKAANLGADVIEKGARRLLKQQDVDIDELETVNKQLSKQIQTRIDKIDEELSHAPPDFEENRRRRDLMMQIAATPDVKDPCITPPPVAIFNDIPRDGGDGCRVEVTNNAALGRVYPVLIVRGTGWDHMLTGEVYCEYIWAFRTSTTGQYLINPYIEFHGRVVQTREHHCYSNTSGSGWDYQLTMGHAQPPDIPSPLFTDMEGTLPHVAGTFRYDGERTPNYMPFLYGDRLTFVHIGLRFTVSARSRHATTQVNFGDPGDENFIGIHHFCWQPPGTWP